MTSKAVFHNKLILCFFISMFLGPLYGQSSEQLNIKINSLVEEQNLSGAVWTIVNEQGEIKTDACGYKSLITKDKLGADNKVLVGSVAKTVIATAFLRMATLEILRLDEPVKKYLPNIPIKNKWEDTNPVTLRHLLDHTSGLADVKLWQVFSTTAKPNTPLEFAYNQSPDLLITQARPGSIHSYSNIGYCILGKIIEVISKKPFEKYLEEELLRPLGMMYSSFYYISQENDNQLAFGHFDDGLPIYAEPMYLRPAGQFSTTAYDMGLLLRFMMSDGTINGKQFIKKELLSEVGNQTNTDAFKIGISFGEALGAYKRDRYGVIGIAKNGNTLGFRSMIYMFPEFQKAFFIAFNMDSETSQYDLFNEVLTNHLHLPVKRFRDEGNRVHNQLKLWEGFYIPAITKVKPFQLLDMVFNFTQVTVFKNHVTLSSFHGKKKNLLYQQDNLFSMDDRIGISHAFYKESDGTYFITDGINTLQKTNGYKILSVAASLGLGAISMLYFLITGIFRILKTKTKSFSSIEFPVFILLVILVFVFTSIALQSIIKLGDMSFVSIMLAITTFLLPFVSLWTVFILIYRQKQFLQSATFWASISVIQCCFLLTLNDLMPIVLWK